MADLASLGIKVTTSGVREASKDLNSLTKEGKEAEKQFKATSIKAIALGNALGDAITGGFKIAGSAIKKYFENTIEAERVQAQLAARIKSTGNAARLSLVDLNKMAEALQFKTSFDDESIGEVQALLLTFTKIGRETFPQATEAVLDLSTAMGTDLNSAALQLGKALNDPVKGITALSRAGVQFSESQKATIKDLVKTGDVAGAQAIILKELEVRMGGAAVAARNTLGGALKALENSFDNLLEGDSGDAGVKGARDAIEELNKTLNDPAVKKGFADMVAGLASIASTAASAIGPLMDLIKLQRESFGFSQKLAGNGRRAPEARDSVQGLAASNAALLRGDLRTFAAARARALQGELGIGEIADFSGVTVTTSGRAKARNPRGGSNRPEAFVPIAPEEEEEDKKNTGGGRSRAAREMPNFAKEDAEDLRRLIEQTVEADKQFEGLAATLAGPLQAAQFQYKQNLQEITELGQTAGRSSEEIAAAKAMETKRYEEERAEIEKSLDVFGQLTEAKQFELDLMGLSNVERQTAIDLQRLGRKATEEETEAIRAQNQAYEDRSRTIGLMDDFRRSASDNLSDFIKGTKSAKEAALDFLGSVADMLIEIAAKQLIAKAFGDQGSTGAGTGGGDWMSALMGLFGGSSGGTTGSLASLFDGQNLFSEGGWTGNGARNKAAGIVHGQEGVLNADAMQRVGIANLNRLNAGAKLGDVAGGASNVTNVTTFVLPTRYTPQTQAQIDQNNQRVQQRATQRNG